MFTEFFLDSAQAGQVLHVQHDPLLVVLSVSVAMLASTLALHMVKSGAQAPGKFQRSVALLCGCSTLGMGVWAMHFIGMLALELSIPVHYDQGMTLLSMLPSMLASGIALHLLLRDRNSVTRLLAAGVIVGIGIAAMHYCGMAAMHMDAALRYEPMRFFASLVVAIGLATAAVVAWGRMSQHTAQAGWPMRLVPAVILGLAITCMHYVSMAAARFVAKTSIPGSVDASESHSLALLVAASTLVLFIFTGLCSAMLRYRSLWQQVQRSEARLKAMAATAVDAVITIDASGLVQTFNPAAERIFGWSAKEVIGQNLRMLMPPPLADHHDQYLENYLSTGQKKIIGSGREVLGLHRDGRHIPLRLSIGQADTPDGPIFVGFAYDLSERKRTETQLRIAASVFDHAHEGIAVVDAHQCLWQVNPAFLRMMGLNEQQVQARGPFEELFSETVPPLNAREMWQTVNAQGYWQSEFRMHNANGKTWQQRLSLTAVHNEQKRLSHYIAIASDIGLSSMSAAGADTSHLYDELTGLPNQVLLMERITHAIPSARRHGTLLGVIALNFDHFTRVNQIHGAAVGDELLQKMALRMRRHLREEDTLARGQGDELVAVLAGLKDEAGLHIVLNRFKVALEQPLELSSVVIHISATLGWAISSTASVPKSELLVQNAREMVKQQKRLNQSSVLLQQTG